MRYRTIFISDIHLGTKGCQAQMLLDFLAEHQADVIYLVGDIIDAWRLQRGWFWPQGHNDVVQELLSRAHDGARIYYIPGNHDEMMRSYLGTHFGGVEVMETADHVTADGRRLLVTHGDQFDAIVVNARWLAHVGDRAYGFALWLNTWVNRAKRLWGGQYWSLSNWAKAQVKHAVNYISEYEDVLADEARRGGYDGIVCGHIHSASLRKIGGLDYINTGDWVESCTAVVEESDGRLRLIDWAEIARAREAAERARRPQLVRRRARANAKSKEAA
ncbi:UDP-2,3-diacylglucosamine hydrolase [Pseudooceanicola lipolyticus]|uniref:UDP-2,3-diacylglucosamine hydrolase n=2 Tax=Pseudooceanicola lipolyticus TaxID=2029104 RepID=A0A2M8IZL2_9RHOB|nr:UDP-2,3-diacylglucosamine diphosphatase [Pseudooceanicola lipolyticus]PJE35971.1 UDP-2,3-diacylglucosamine hydrolase [Pseudooceanicola lipolyticus]